MRHCASRILRTALFALALASAAGAAVHEVNVGPPNSFDPADITIAVGDTVRFNRFGFHTVVEDGGAWSSPPPDSWLTFTPPPFNTPGVVEYYCSLHSTAGGTTMNGIIRVQEGGGGGAGSLQFTVASASVGEGAGNVTVNV
jgi:plastocyanin